MIKRVIVLIALFFISVHSYASAAEKNENTGRYKIYIDNKELKLSTPTFIQNGVTMVPFRAFFSQLGFDVEWNSEHKQVIGTNADQTIILTIGSPYANVNGNIEVMPLEALTRNGTTYVPLRFVGTASGGSVELYGGVYNAIWITSAKSNQLLDAVFDKNLVEVKKLLESGADPTVRVSPAGPAIYHFVDESVEIVKLFLENGMDINYPGALSNELTLLQSAVSGGYVDVVSFLLSSGADPTQKHVTGWTALEIAEYWRIQVENGYQNIIDPLNTPTVEEYDEIIKLLQEAVNIKAEHTTLISQ